MLFKNNHTARCAIVCSRSNIFNLIILKFINELMY